MKLNEIVKNKLPDNVEEIKEFLEQHNIKKFKIHPDGTVDVTGKVVFFRTKDIVGKLPIKFGVVKGDFHISECPYIESLEGCPKEVTGNLTIEFNDTLKSLKGFSEKVGKETLIKFNKLLTSLSGLEVLQETKFLHIRSNERISSLEGFPNFEGVKNASIESMLILKTLEGLPQDRPFHLSVQSCNSLKDLTGCPPKLTSLHLAHNINMVSLKGAPAEIEKSIVVANQFNLSTLEYLPKKIGEALALIGNPKAKNVLQLFKLNIGDPKISNDFPKGVNEILNKWLPKGDMIECQEELIEAGFKEYARLK